jgi:hypothetical protein
MQKNGCDYLCAAFQVEKANHFVDVEDLELDAAVLDNFLEANCISMRHIYVVWSVQAMRIGGCKWFVITCNGMEFARNGSAVTRANVARVATRLFHMQEEHAP